MYVCLSENEHLTELFSSCSVGVREEGALMKKQ